MQLNTSLTLYPFASLTHYHIQHVWLRAPRMKPVSILSLFMVSKDDHLFGADHIWKEVLGLSKHWAKWRSQHGCFYLSVS
jgi:hypothetical protein